MLEAAQRGVEGDDGQPRDTRTFPEMVVAELVRLVDTMQALSLRQDVFEEELAGRRGMVDAAAVPAGGFAETSRRCRANHGAGAGQGQAVRHIDWVDWMWIAAMAALWTSVILEVLRQAVRP